MRWPPPTRPPKNIREALDRGEGEEFEPVKFPEPTDAEPGSVEKIRLLRERAERGQHLFVLGDRTVRPNHEWIEAVEALREVDNGRGFSRARFEPVDDEK